MKTGEDSTDLKIKVGILADKVDGVADAVKELSRKQDQLGSEIKKYYPEKESVKQDIVAAIQLHDIEKHAGINPFTAAKIIMACLGTGGMGAGIKHLVDSLSK